MQATGTSGAPEPLEGCSSVSVTSVVPALHGAQPAGSRRHGVVFVHGIGPALKSGTLLDFGTPLLEWLERWHRACGSGMPSVTDIDLDFTPVDEGERDRPAVATVTLPTGDRWIWTEAWWAESIRQPDFWALVWWSIDHLLAIITHLGRFTWRRLLCIWSGGKAVPGATMPPWWARVIDFLNAFGLLLVYTPVSVVVGVTLLVPLILAAQIPIAQVQDFFLVHVFRNFLLINVGQFWTFLEDDFQSANMCRRVADAIECLLDPARGDDQAQDVTVVAYSGGCPIAFAVLTSPEYQGLASQVTKFVTLGNGLNKAWDIEPHLDRIRGTLPGHIHWVDLWGSYDPVPSGWLVPPGLGQQKLRRRVLGALALNRKGKRLPRPPAPPAAQPATRPSDEMGNDQTGWVRIFAPNDRVVALQGLKPRVDPDPDALAQLPAPPHAIYWPVSEQITNGMNVLTDHGGYWVNDEQFQVRLAAEIDEEVYWHSPFWRGEVALCDVDLRPGHLNPGQLEHSVNPTHDRTEALRRAVEDRRKRVSVWAGGRDLALLVALVTVGWFWWSLWQSQHDRGGFWNSSVAMPGAGVDSASWIYWLVPIIDRVQRFLNHVPVLGSLVTPMLTAPYCLVGAAVFGTVVTLLFLGVPGVLWGRWDVAARRIADERIARAR